MVSFNAFPVFRRIHVFDRPRVMSFFIVFSSGGRVLERGQSEIRYQYDKAVKVLSAILVTWENMQPLGAAPLVTEVPYYGFLQLLVLQLACTRMTFRNNYYNVRLTLWWCCCKSSWFDYHYFSPLQSTNTFQAAVFITDQGAFANFIYSNIGWTQGAEVSSRSIERSTVSISGWIQSRKWKDPLRAAHFRHWKYYVSGGIW